MTNAGAKEGKRRPVSEKLEWKYFAHLVERKNFSNHFSFFLDCLKVIEVHLGSSKLQWIDSKRPRGDISVQKDNSGPFICFHD